MEPLSNQEAGTALNKSRTEQTQFVGLQGFMEESKSNGTDITGSYKGANHVNSTAVLQTNIPLLMKDQPCLLCTRGNCAAL